MLAPPDYFASPAADDAPQRRPLSEYQSDELRRGVARMDRAGDGSTWCQCAYCPGGWTRGDGPCRACSVAELARRERPASAADDVEPFRGLDDPMSFVDWVIVLTVAGVMLVSAYGVARKWFGWW